MRRGASTTPRSRAQPGLPVPSTSQDSAQVAIYVGGAKLAVTTHHATHSHRERRHRNMRLPRASWIAWEAGQESDALSRLRRARSPGR
jgi:hypothetical protein